MAQISQPNGDVPGTNVGWTPTPLYPHLNGSTFNDSNPISATVPPTASFTEYLSPLSAPIVGQAENTFQPHTLTVRLNGYVGTSATVTLLDTIQGTDQTIASQQFTLSPGFQNYTLTLDYRTTALIQDYTALKVKVDVSGPA